jgi:hypothetical protein
MKEEIAIDREMLSCPTTFLIIKVGFTELDNVH